MTRRLLAVVTAVLLSACGGGEQPSGEGAGDDVLVPEVASFDIAAGNPSRFLVGLSTGMNEYVSGGSVDVEFFYLGEQQAGEPEAAGEATAEFLPLPDATHEVPEEPTVVPASGRGVYSIEEFTFDRPGIWELEVRGDVADRGEMSGTTPFEVLPEPAIPAPGQEAPATENLTLDTKDAPPEAVDSRATTGEIPDPELHDATVAETIAAGRPALVVIATPVYCVSRFCGPVTDMIQGLAAEYGDRAEFIHIEVWRDFEGQVVNKGAADWILRNDTLQEPWVFLIGADGRIVERWDNVATRQEIEPHLQDLPPLDA